MQECIILLLLLAKLLHNNFRNCPINLSLELSNTIVQVLLINVNQCQSKNVSVAKIAKLLHRPRETFSREEHLVLNV